MVAAVRRGQSRRAVARQFGVGLATVAYWVERAKGQHLDRVDWPDRWFHVRVSQTEPIVRIICEQRGAPPRELFDAVIEQVRSFA